MRFQEDEKACPICLGQGVIEVDDLTSILCNCTRTRLMRVHLGPEIASAKKLTESLLFERGLSWNDPPVIDRTRENLFLKGHWQDLIAHFRYALICKGLMFRFQVITDERIKTVYVGADSFEKRAREERDRIKKTFNSLQDIICEHDLSIIRLGFLGHKNQAMPGALKEALMLREVQRKPTWIVEAPQSPFIPGHHAYSEEVWDYINANFSFLDMADPNRVTTEVHGVDVPKEIRATQDQPRYVREQPLDEAARPSVEPDDIETFMSTGSKKPKHGKFGKRGASGGPV